MTASLADVLDLEQLDLDLFRSRFNRENFRSTLFGGQVLGQALTAAARSVGEDRLPNSMHAYFLRPGKSEAPVIYDVKTVRDGRSFSTRRVLARQQGRPIFFMSASFHVAESGYEHAEPMPQVPPPEVLEERQGQDPHLRENDAKSGQHGTPFHFLPVEETLFSSQPQPAKAHFWLKSADPLPDPTLTHYSALAFASDLGLLATALLPHQASLFDGSVLPASVDHAMWFHRSDFRTDDWLLYAMDSPWAGCARGFSRGAIYTRDGRLVASTAQEGLIRPLG